MKKGMSATETIVSLVIGLLVIGGLGYLLYSWISSGSTQLSEAECSARALTYCTQWSMSGYDSGNMPKGGWATYAPTCENIFDVDQGYCEDL